jgi:hypothetical protein
MFTRLRLEIAVLALDNFREYLDRTYGDPAMRAYDTCRYLDQIDARMTAEDRAVQKRLSVERAEATTAATEAELDAVLDARREYNLEPEVNPDR